MSLSTGEVFVAAGAIHIVLPRYGFRIRRGFQKAASTADAGGAGKAPLDEGDAVGATSDTDN